MSRSRFATYILPGIAVLALAGGISVIARQQTTHAMVDPAIPPPAPPPEQAATIGAVGLVEAASEQIGIAASVAGPVTEVRVKPGQIVRAGDVLFVQDSRQPRADLLVQRAALDSARAKLAEAEAAAADLADQLARSERLYKMSPGTAISDDTILRRRFAQRTADAHVMTARTDVASAEATLQSAEVTVERLTVRAPIDGTILQVNVRPGESAPATPLTTPLIVLGQLTPLHLRADIDETDVPRFNPKAPAWASARGAAAKRVQLSLVRVDPLVVPKQSLTNAGTERVDTRVLRVVYAFDPKDLPAYPGQQMDVFIALQP